MVLPSSPSLLTAMISLSLPFCSSAYASESLDLEVLWCTHEEFGGFITSFSALDHDVPRIWIDGYKVELQERKSTGEENQQWLVNIDEAIFVEATQADSPAELHLEGVVKGKIVEANCEDITDPITKVLVLMEPALVTQLEVADDEIKATSSEVVTLSEENQKLREELAELQTALREKSSTESEIAQTEKALESAKLRISTLENFVAQVRNEVVIATHLPNEYVKVFNQHYWALIDQLSK